MNRYRVTLTVAGPVIPGGSWSGTTDIDAEHVGELHSRLDDAFEDMDVPDVEGADLKPEDITSLGITFTLIGVAPRKRPRKRVSA